MEFIVNQRYKYKDTDNNSFVSIIYLGKINIYINDTDYRIDTLINDMFPTNEQELKKIYIMNKLYDDTFIFTNIINVNCFINNSDVKLIFTSDMDLHSFNRHFYLNTDVTLINFDINVLETIDI